MRVPGMGWAGAITEQYEASQEFFTEQLGLPLQFEAKKHVISHLRQPSGQILELYGPSNRQRRPEKYCCLDGHALGFEVEDLEFGRLKMVNRGTLFIHGIETCKEGACSMFLGPEDKLLQIQTLGRHPPKKSSQLLAFSWSGVVVQDFDGAVRFFTQAMQLPLARREDDQSLAQFRLPDGHLFEVLGSRHPWRQNLGSTAIGFEVKDVEGVRSEMEERGVEFVSGIKRRLNGDLFTFFRDLDGYQYALWKPGERANK